MSERAKLEPLPWVLDVLGLPQIDEVVPMPADVAKEVGVPTPRDVILGIVGDVKGKAQGIGRRF